MADYRYIRRAFLGSRRIKYLGWMQECFFHRLLLIADDYGLFEADPAVLRATLFPQHLDRISEEEVEACMKACTEAGLLLMYEDDGHPLGLILRYKQRCQGAPKLPLPPGFTIKKEGREYFLVEPPAGSTGITVILGSHGNHGEKQTCTVIPGSHGNHGLNGSGSEYGNESEHEQFSSAGAPEERETTPTRAGTEDFDKWLSDLKATHPASRNARKLTKDALTAAQDAFDRLPDANKEAELLIEYLNIDSDDGFFRPRAIVTFFNRLESTIENAHRWQAQRIKEAPQGLAEWLAPLMNAHPACRKANKLKLGRKVYEAALQAFERSPQAVEQAPLLEAYYKSRLTEDKRKMPFYRPINQEYYFDQLEEVITHAERWARETSWKPKKSTSNAKEKEEGGSAGDDIPCLTPEQLTAYFAEMRKNIEHPVQDVQE